LQKELLIAHKKEKEKEPLLYNEHALNAFEKEKGGEHLSYQGLWKDVVS